MQTLNLNETVLSRPKFIGRKNARKLKRKTRFINFFTRISNIFRSIGSLYIILALLFYILISQAKLNNALINMQKDEHIPSYVIDKVID